MEPHLVAHDFTQRGAQFLRDPLGHAGGGDASRLGMPNEALPSRAPPTPQLQSDLRQLGGLSRPGLSTHNDHLVLIEGLGDLNPSGTDRQ